MNEEIILIEKDNGAYLPRNYLPALNLYQEGEGFTGGSLRLTKSYLVFEGRSGANSFKIPLEGINSFEEIKLGGIFSISIIGTSVEEPTTIRFNLKTSLRDVATETRHVSNTLINSCEVKIKVKNHVAWSAKLAEIIEVDEEKRKIAEEKRKIAEEDILRKQRAQKRQAMKQKASERERALDYDSAINIWEELGDIEEAARVRKLKAEQVSVKVDQTIVHGDYVDDRDTIIKDSVVSKSSIGAGGKSKAEQIKEIKELLDAGAISEEDYQKMKREIVE